jgi:hypothetical protein
MAGRIIIGYSNILNQYAIRYPGARAVYWDDWDNVVPLPYPADSLLPNGEKIFSSEADSISDDGRIIAGNLYFDQRFSPQHHMSNPCVWIYHPVSRNGSFYELLCVLEDIPGGDDCASIDQISGNWAGVAYNATGPCAVETFIDTPVIWNGNDISQPPRDLSIILAPLVSAGWALYEAIRVSADGRTVTGYALDADWNVLGWVAGLPGKAVPVSNWALLVAIALILGLLIFRFYKK